MQEACYPPSACSFFLLLQWLSALTASKSPQSFLKMQKPRPCPKDSDLIGLGGRHAFLSVFQFPKWLCCAARLENYCYTTLKVYLGISLVVQWLGFCASSAGGMGSIPDEGTKYFYFIIYAASHGQKDFFFKNLDTLLFNYQSDRMLYNFYNVYRMNLFHFFMYFCIVSIFYKIYNYFQN